MNFAKFVRTRFIQKTAGTWEIHKNLQNKEQYKNYVENETKLKFFSVDLAYLYVKTRTFLLVNSKMDGHKLFLRKNKTKSRIMLLKIICSTAESS